MVLRSVATAESHPLELVENVDTPIPKGNEVLVRVDVCGVCRTDLHVVEGDLPPVVPRITPGHEIVGTIVETGPNVRILSRGERIGIPWLHQTCGRCEYCLSSRENLCDNKVYTGYTVSGGYSQFALGREDFVFKLPQDRDPEKMAPLLCAGIIGYRALTVSRPKPGGVIGFFGFGASAHLTLQMASKLGFETVAYSRNPSHLELARDLGASRTVLVPQAESEAPSLDSAIVFAPSGLVVLQALRELKKGGVLAIPAVHMDNIPEIDYDKYFFGERKIMSVESNTREDAKEFLELAQRLELESTTTSRKLEEANEALIDLKHGRVSEAFVLDCN